MWYRVYGVSFDVHNLVALVLQIEVDRGLSRRSVMLVLDTNLLVITPRAQGERHHVRNMCMVHIRGNIIFRLFCNGQKLLWREMTRQDIDNRRCLETSVYKEKLRR